MSIKKVLFSLKEKYYTTARFEEVISMLNKGMGTFGI